MRPDDFLARGQRLADARARMLQALGEELEKAGQPTPAATANRAARRRAEKLRRQEAPRHGDE